MTPVSLERWTLKTALTWGQCVEEHNAVLDTIDALCRDMNRRDIEIAELHRTLEATERERDHQRDLANDWCREYKQKSDALAMLADAYMRSTPMTDYSGMKYFSATNFPMFDKPWPSYRKRVLTQAVKIDGPFTVETSEGPLVCRDGYLAIDARGYPYPIATEEFKLIYELAQPEPPAPGPDTQRTVVSRERMVALLTSMVEEGARGIAKGLVVRWMAEQRLDGHQRLTTAEIEALETLIAETYKAQWPAP